MWLPASEISGKISVTSPHLAAKSLHISVSLSLFHAWALMELFLHSVSFLHTVQIEIKNESASPT